jgi:3-oxoacyl-[acyl-carrier protein] reductase
VSLEGKVSIITGGGQGIGKAISKRFAKEGSIVVLAARSEKMIETTLEEIEIEGGTGTCVKTDISCLNDIVKLTEYAINKFSKIDILVNNAGIVKPIGPFDKIDIEEWTENVKVNLFGTFYCVKTVLPHMISKNYGKIINLSGGGAFNPRPNFSAYAVSKAAIVRLTEQVADETKDYNISVNAIAPGMIKTEMTEEIVRNSVLAGNELDIAKKVIHEGGSDVNKVTDLAVFLASKKSEGLTGRTISAQWDDLQYIKNNIREIMESNKFKMMRIV